MKNRIGNINTVDKSLDITQNDLCGIFEYNDILDKLLIRRIMFRNAYFLYNENTKSFELFGGHLRNKKSAFYRTIYIHDDVKKLAYKNKFTAYAGGIDTKCNFLVAKMRVNLNLGEMLDYSESDYNGYCNKYVLPLNIHSIDDVNIDFSNKGQIADRFKSLTLFQTKTEVFNLLLSHNEDDAKYCLNENIDPRIYCLIPYLRILIENKTAFINPFAGKNWEPVCFHATVRFEPQLINNLCKNGKTIDEVLKLPDYVVEELADEPDIVVGDKYRIVCQKNLITQEDFNSEKFDEVKNAYLYEPPKGGQDLYQDVEE